MKKGRIFGYSAITIVILLTIILAVLGALGYLTPRKPSSPGLPVIHGGVNVKTNLSQLYDIRPMWGVCMGGSPKTFNGVQYRLQSACESPTCQVEINATYVYSDGTTDVTTRTVGDSGLYHNPPSDVFKIPTSAHVEVYANSNLQNTYDVPISPSC
jgi:hypothetical protein